MTVINEVQFDSVEAAMEAANTKSLAQLFPDGLPNWTQVYVSSEGKIVAADIPRDARPADEVMSLGPYVSDGYGFRPDGK